MKKFLLSIIYCTSVFSSLASTNLLPGDIAIIGFNFKDPDEFSFITFKDLDEGTMLYFTDCGWKNNGMFRKGEGLITYTVPLGGKKAYNIISYPSDPGFTTQGISGFFGLTVNGDQLLAFQGTFDNPQFIFALTTYHNGWQTDAIDNNSTILPTALVTSHAYISFDLAINGIYNCDQNSSSTQSISIPSITNPENWILSPERVTLPGSCLSSSLPIVISEFRINEENNESKARVTISVENNSLVQLEESDNGKGFQMIESWYVNSGTTFITFKSVIKKNYYRVSIFSNGINYYSKVLVRNEEIEEVIICTYYNLVGEELKNFCDDRFDEDYLQPVIKREITNKGRIIITKVFPAY